MSYCTNCGYDISEDVSNCPSCGVDLKLTPPQTAETVSKVPVTLSILSMIIGIIIPLVGIMFELNDNAWAISLPIAGIILGLYGALLTKTDAVRSPAQSNTFKLGVIAAVMSLVLLAVYVIL